ncbi:hypothetical protein SJ05684_c11380 [Sinorhizobium sojae CCBAU 05684]|uniref:Uncharacterized protein n=1 Tax=Sinorhizobium sojae CCBAU 05684 TaxID=716928 RepID=A0A249PA82_9HYPH|nr:hypothetical protein SJ05684_c11380 [Sinorhizobium sojae CCBAU 05684]
MTMSIMANVFGLSTRYDTFLAGMLGSWPGEAICFGKSAILLDYF